MVVVMVNQADGYDIIDLKTVEITESVSYVCGNEALFGGINRTSLEVNRIEVTGKVGVKIYKVI